MVKSYLAVFQSLIKSILCHLWVYIQLKIGNTTVHIIYIPLTVQHGLHLLNIFFLQNRFSKYNGSFLEKKIIRETDLSHCTENGWLWWDYLNKRSIISKLYSQRTWNTIKDGEMKRWHGYVICQIYTVALKFAFVFMQFLFCTWNNFDMYLINLKYKLKLFTTAGVGGQGSVNFEDVEVGG